MNGESEGTKQEEPDNWLSKPILASFRARYVSSSYFSLTVPAMIFYEARRVSLPLYQVVAFY